MVTPNIQPILSPSAVLVLKKVVCLHSEDVPLKFQSFKVWRDEEEAATYKGVDCENEKNFMLRLNHGFTDSSSTSYHAYTANGCRQTFNSLYKHCQSGSDLQPKVGSLALPLGFSTDLDFTRNLTFARSVLVNSANLLYLQKSAVLNEKRSLRHRYTCET